MNRLLKYTRDCDKMMWGMWFCSLAHTKTDKRLMPCNVELLGLSHTHSFSTPDSYVCVCACVCVCLQKGEVKYENEIKQD